MADGLNLSDSNENLFEQREDFIPFLKKYIEYKGADITPFVSLLNQTISPKKILNSSVDFGLVTVKFPPGKGISLSKKQMHSENITQFILASASCFPVFPMCKIDGEYYVDGGYYDNLPIDFALKLGADTILAVDLNCNITHISYFNDPRVTYMELSKSSVSHEDSSHSVSHEKSFHSEKNFSHEDPFHEDSSWKDAPFIIDQKSIISLQSLIPSLAPYSVKNGKSSVSKKSISTSYFSKNGKSFVDKNSIFSSAKARISSKLCGRTFPPIVSFLMPSKRL